MATDQAVKDEAKAILNDAADLIETTGWTRDSSARLEDGSPCSPCDEMAVCFCLFGATTRAGQDRESSADGQWLAHAAIGATSRDEFGMYASTWNDADCEGPADAVAVLRLAAFQYVDKVSDAGFGRGKGVGLLP